MTEHKQETRKEKKEDLATKATGTKEEKGMRNQACDILYDDDKTYAFCLGGWFSSVCIGCDSEDNNFVGGVDSHGMLGQLAVYSPHFGEELESLFEAAKEADK